MTHENCDIQISMSINKVLLALCFQKFIEMVSSEMEGASLPVRIIKPKPTSVPMVDGNYRVRTLIRCKDVYAQREIFRKIYIEFSKDKECKDIQMTLDMNPAVVY